jgi:hypothetical protein
MKKIFKFSSRSLVINLLHDGKVRECSLTYTFIRDTPSTTISVTSANRIVSVPRLFDRYSSLSSDLQKGYLEVGWDTTLLCELIAWFTTSAIYLSGEWDCSKIA